MKLWAARVEPAAFVLFDYEGFLRKHGDSPVLLALAVGGQLQMALEAGATDGDCMSLVRLWQQRGLLIPESSFSLLLDKVRAWPCSSSVALYS
ncbi:hypothetical protein T484DRAFT_1789926 [Baffinella frigidus]|nr:hypothetical protein T484DRAFT_1789926 [Cryptophyta sp. CCMP2293]